MKKQVNFRASDLTRRQLEELQERWGTTQSEAVTVAIDRAYREGYGMTWISPEGELLTLTAIQTATDAAAQAIATLDPDKWAGWVTYLLEALDGQAPEEDFRAMLEEVSRAVKIRLTLGRW